MAREKHHKESTTKDARINVLVWRVRYLESQRRLGGTGTWHSPHQERLIWRNRFLQARLDHLEQAISATPVPSAPPRSLSPPAPPRPESDKDR